MLPPSHTVLWLLRSLLLPSLLSHTSTLLRYLISSLNISQPRIVTSTLSSLQQVLSFSPSLLTSPSIQKALGTVMTTSHLPSILDRVIDILLIDVKEFASQTLLIRTILSLALRSENTTVISRAFRFISLVMKELIHTEPIPIQQIVKLEHMTLKYVCHEADATIQQLSFATLGICWEISSIPLHSAIASPLVDSHSSFVPQDVNLYDVLVNALNCPSCQTVIEKEIDELVKNYLDSSEMKGTDDSSII